jgi:glycosyltransferase (activator-dependent family)
VRFASQPRLTDVVTDAGLTAVPVGRDTGFWRLADLNPDRREALRAGLPDPYRAAALDPTHVSWAAMRAGYEERATRWHRLDNFPMVAGLVEYARHWQPDLIIWDPLTYAGSIAAKVCGAAHARLLWSIDVFGVTRDHYRRLNTQQPPHNQADPMADWLTSYGRKYGFDFTEDLITGHFTIDQLPDSLRMEANLHYLPMQYIPYGGPAVIPNWLHTPPPRPRVALTLGITATERFAGYTSNVQDILNALADLDIELIATIAETEQRKLRHIPDNTRVLTYVPLHALAPTCAAVINHAGPGTLLTTALCAVPQLTVPWDFDEPELARRTARQGAALTLRADQATGHTIRDALLRLLHEPVFHERAVALRDEIRALPTPNQIVGQLEQLTTKHRATSR